MFLFRSMINNPEYSPANAQVIFNRALKDIKCKVHVWHGEKDLTVNAGFVRYYKEKIPQCQAEFFPDEGHFSLAANKIDHMFEAMLGKS